MVPMTPKAFSHSPLSPRHLITVQYVDIYIIHTCISLYTYIYIGWGERKREREKRKVARGGKDGGGEREITRTSRSTGSKTCVCAREIEREGGRRSKFSF
jgi:hypothetical protein